MHAAQQKNVVRVDHGSVGSLTMDFPDGPTIKGIQRRLAGGHIVESAQPDKLIGVVQIIKLTRELNTDRLLCFDKFALKELDQFITPAWMEGIHPEFDNRRIGWLAHVRSNPMIQFVSQVFPPSIENACSHWQEVTVIFDQMKRL